MPTGFSVSPGRGVNLRILGNTVMYNEAHRYLFQCMEWHSGVFDGISAFDDGSTDDSVAIAESFGAQVQIRGPLVPSFMDHEGRFRQAAWEWFEESQKPEAGDWVFAFDADEFLFGTEDEHSLLMQKCLMANEEGVGAFNVQVPEVWATLDGGVDPQIRVDGYWASNTHTRLFKWEPDGKYRDKAMGCGSEPTFVAQAQSENLKSMYLLHYGYADPDDRREKYERYSGHRNHGHNAAHILSIIQSGQLRAWDGPCTRVERGIPEGRVYQRSSSSEWAY